VDLDRGALEKLIVLTLKVSELRRKLVTKHPKKLNLE
jgi:hypothetical protein